MNIALIVFAGTGSRINSSVPKQFIKINGKELVTYTIEKFQSNPSIDEIVLVTHKDYLFITNKLVTLYKFDKVKDVVVGGASRQESVRLGLESLKDKCRENDRVLIHDGDRPLVSQSIINESVKALDKYDAVCPIIKHEDGMDKVSNSGRRVTLCNEEYDVQTPQSFKYGVILAAHESKKKYSFSDDIGLVENEVEVEYIPGDKDNFKVTLDVDLETIIGMIK